VNQPARLAKALDPTRRSRGSSTAHRRGRSGSRSPPDRPRRSAAVEAAAKRPASTSRCVHAGAHGRLAGATDVDRSPCSSRSPTGSATTRRRRTPCPPRSCWWTRRSSWTPPPRDDGAGWRMRVLGANYGHRSTASSRAGPRPHERLLRESPRHGYHVKATSDAQELFEGRDSKTGKVKWTPPVWTSSSGPTRSPRAAEVYAQDDAKERFVATSRRPGPR